MSKPFSFTESIVISECIPEGPSGPTGPTGPRGAMGMSGKIGATGATGQTGLRGAIGPTGMDGIAGDTGLRGATGPTGMDGVAGATGPTGMDGVAGATGPTGMDGAAGATGPTGMDGVAGAMGPTGMDGAAGATGPTGMDGQTGLQGLAGPTGSDGQIGASSYSELKDGSIIPLPIFNKPLFQALNSIKSTIFTEDQNPIKVYAVEGKEWPENSAYSIFFTRGPGIVESIQFATVGENNVDALLTVTVDGKNVCGGTDSGSFFGFSLYPPASTIYGGTGTCSAITNGYANKNYTSQSADPNMMGCTRRCFIPFSSSCTIQLDGHVTGNKATTIFSQVVYRIWPSVLPLYTSIGRKKYWHAWLPEYNGGKQWSVPAFGSVTPWTLSGPGQIENIGQVLWNSNSITALEGGCTLRIDGEPQTWTSTDNFYGGQFYWQNGKTIANSENAGVYAFCNKSYGNFNFHSYKWFTAENPVYFNDSISFSWCNGNKTRSDANLSSATCIFYVSWWTTY